MTQTMTANALLSWTLLRVTVKEYERNEMKQIDAATTTDVWYHIQHVLLPFFNFN